MHPVVACRADGDVARAIGIAEMQARRIDSDGTMVAFCRGRAGERTRLAVERGQGRPGGVAPKALGGGHEAQLPDFALLVLSVVITRNHERVIAVDERGAQLDVERVHVRLDGGRGQGDVVVIPALHGLRKRQAWKSRKDHEYANYRVFYHELANFRIIY